LPVARYPSPGKPLDHDVRQRLECDRADRARRGAFSYQPPNASITTSSSNSFDVQIENALATVRLVGRYETTSTDSVEKPHKNGEWNC